MKILIILVCTLLANPTFAKTVRLFNCRVLIDHQIQFGELWIANGKIIAPQSRAEKEINCNGFILAPGFIDLQMNGGFGVDFSTCPERVCEVAKRLPQFGVTSFLPTVVSLKRDFYPRTLSCLQPKKGGKKQGSCILGMHLEGPFFNPNQFGAHDPNRICSLDEVDSLDGFFGNLEGVKIVTLAPELNGAFRTIERLRERKIVVSIGHSNATFDETLFAFNCGCTFVTHLFNAMRPFHHRNPGIVGAVLTRENVFFSIIADGFHLHPASICLAWRCNPRGLVLITDAIEAFGLPPEGCRLGSMDLDIIDGRAFIKGTNTIAGSIISLDAAVRFFRSCTGCSCVEALEAASLRPAQVLGIEHCKGTLKIGADADFILLDDDLFVKCCFIAGERTWGKL